MTRSSARQVRIGAALEDVRGTCDIAARLELDPVAVVHRYPRAEDQELIGLLASAVAFGNVKALSQCPDIDLAMVKDHLDGVCRICAGGTAAGPIGLLNPGERFRWLVAPRSTVLQTSPAHAGLCEEPDVALERLLDQLVRTTQRSG